MSSNFEHADRADEVDYGAEYRPERQIFVIKKDGDRKSVV